MTMEQLLAALEERFTSIEGELNGPIGDRERLPVVGYELRELIGEPRFAARVQPSGVRWLMYRSPPPCSSGRPYEANTM